MSDFDRASNDQLIGQYNYHTAMLETSREKLGRIEYELTRRMQQDGATEMVTAGHSATLKSSVSYDQTRLQAVMELVPEEDLVKAGAFTPEHEETTTVPARWNVTKLNPFARRGREIREVIDAARMEGVPRLTVQKERDRGG